MNRFSYPWRKSALVALVVAVLLPAPSPGAEPDTLEAIQTKIAQYLKRPGIRSAAWGIQIYDPASGAVVLSVNPEKTFQPASVLKVVTTATALEKLGPDYRSAPASIRTERSWQTERSMATSYWWAEGTRT